MNVFSGGYYIIAPVERPDYMDHEVIPDTVLSMSECISDIYPDITILWGTSMKAKREYAQRLKVSQEAFEELESWVEDQLDAGSFKFPHVFSTVELAREFLCKFLGHLSAAKIIGIGLPEEYVTNFIDYEQSLNKEEETRYGIEHSLVHKNSIEGKGANMLGYEILGFESGTFHSYLCNGLEKDFKDHFSFKLNEHGLIPSLDDAARYCNYSNNEELGTEPVLWFPWAVFEYTM